MGFYRNLKPDELMHHGVLGMKWGVRRYQSYDTVPRGSGESGKEIGEAKKNRSRKAKKPGYKRDPRTESSVTKAYRIAGTAINAISIAIGVYSAYQMFSPSSPKMKNFTSKGKQVSKRAFSKPLNIYDGKSLSSLTYKDLEKLDLW